jgi:RNA polymerase sigma factor (sigma-70 family)
MPEIDPIRVITRIKNNRLLQCREEMGMTVTQFINHVGISIGTYYNTVALKRYPSQEIAQRIASATGYSIDYLFPDYLKIVSKTVAVKTISEPQMVALNEAKQHNLITDGGIESTEDAILLDEEHKVISDVLSTLTPRQERVIKMRYGLAGKGEYTLDEIARRLSLTRERIRQIESKALNKLRNGPRKSMLKERLGNTLVNELTPKPEPEPITETLDPDIE